MNIKKLFAVLAGVSFAANAVLPGLALAAQSDQELQDAYEWAHSKSITTMSSFEAANMYGDITRAELAKMLSNWAMNVKGKTPNESAVCNFTDIESVKGDLHDYIITSCQLGLMGQNMPENKFLPYDKITRAQFGTALSRALWGNTYEGGKPYYRNHLSALQAEGIMKVIDNAENRNEMRGYVMLMLMRTDETSNSGDGELCDLCLAVSSAEKCADICGEAENNTDTTVKAGDLAVTATASSDKKIIVGEDGGVSDTDTLTFKTSEEVTITKVTLERYGFSEAEVISGVRLEDADGNIIAEAKGLNDKDQVTLSIKKDYRKVDGTYVATIVVETNTGTTSAAGGTMGFKVTDVQSTAENLNVDDYKPYTYDLVVYGGTRVELSRFGNDKDYNYEAGEMYEVARFRVKAGSSAVTINGFTLTNNFTGNKVDIEKNLDKVEVTANGEKVAVKYSVNKDDQVVVTLSDGYELAAKKNVSFVVNASLQDFDDYGYGVKFEIANNDLKAIEQKTETRVAVDIDGTWAEHTFRGGKIKLSDANLKDVEAAAGSAGVVIAEGKIELGEAIKLNEFKVKVSTGNVIEAMTLVVPGDEYDASHNADYTEWTFSKVVLEESGKVQIKVDIDEDYTGSADVTFQIGTKKTLDKDVVAGAKYEELKNQFVEDKNVSGSIKLVTLKVQVAKASLENTLSKSKAVEFIADKGDTKVVFDGTYTAKKGDVTLTSFWFEGIPAELSGYLTLSVFIDDTEVGNVDTFSSTGATSIERFSNVKVKKDGSVKVKVKAYISSDIEGETYPTKATFDLYLQGEDADGNDTGKGSDSIAPISVKDSGSVVIPSGEGSNTVKLKGRGETIAYFVVKPANGAEGIYLDKLALTIAGGVAGAGSCANAKEEVVMENQPTDADACTGAGGTWTPDDVDPTTGTCANAKEEVVMENQPTAETACTNAGGTWAPGETAAITANDIKVNIGDDKDVDVSEGLTYKPKTELPKEGLVVEVILKDEAAGDYTVTADVNDGSATKTFNRKFVEALVNVEKQENKGDYTKFTLSVEKYDDTVEITGFDLKAGSSSVLATPKAHVSNGDTVNADNGESSRSITNMVYYVDGEEVSLDKATYEDFFVAAADGEDIRVFSNNK